MSKRTPFVAYEWRPDMSGAMRIYWALVAANGEIQCQSSQGSRDMTDARRSVSDVIRNLCGPATPPGFTVRERVAAKRPPSLAKYHAKAKAKEQIARNAVEDAKLWPVAPAALTAGQQQQTDGNNV